MKLHEDLPLFRDAITITAQQMNLPEIYVEKDYWVTLALFSLFHSDLADEIVFKGGTALAKCFKIIERFSEDIDLVVLRKETETGNQLKNKLKKITKIVDKVMPEYESEISNKMGMIRKTTHLYPKSFAGDFGQVRDSIIVEASWLGHFEPYHTMPINSFVYEMMMRNNQLDLAEEYGLLPFEVLVLDARRTLCEKIMSLVRFSHTSKPMEDLRNKVRHTYDIHKLLTVDEISTFFNSAEFEVMLLKVGHDDLHSFRNSNEWLKIHPAEAIIFKDTKEVWEQLKSAYNGEFRGLVMGDFPDDTEIVDALTQVEDRLKSIEWIISK